MDFQRGYYMGDTSGTSGNPNPLQKQISRIKTNPKLNSYEDLVEDFGNYLEETSHYSFDIYGETYYGEQVIQNVPYIHRWTSVYRKSILARLYRLESWHKRTQKPVTFLTLTTYQDGDYSCRQKGYSLDIQEALKLLGDSFRKLREMIRNRIKGYAIDYFCLLEPHDTGYAHLHMIIFDEFTQDEQDKIKYLWSEKYEAGASFGVNFQFKKPKESIQSIRNYAMKYLAKGLRSSGSKYYKESWSPAEAVFNAVLWQTKTRLWSCSWNIGKIINQRPDKQEFVYDEDGNMVPNDKVLNPGVMWYKTVLRGVPDMPECTVWNSPTLDINGFRTHKGNTGKDILIKFKQLFHSRSSCYGLGVTAEQLLKLDEI
jgi:hypothetical protein